jgi:integrase
LKDVASRLLQGSLTKSSRDSYNRIYHNYEQFSQLYFPYQQVLPAALESLTMFIAHCFEQNYAAATVSTYISALSYIHKRLGLQDNTQHFIINKALNGFQKLRASKDNRLPITPSILKGLINSLPHTCTCTSLFMSKLLKAMYLLAFHAFVRVGEIIGQLPPNGNNLQ